MCKFKKGAHLYKVIEDLKVIPAQEKKTNNNIMSTSIYTSQR